MLQNANPMTGPRYVLISAFGFAVMAALVKEAGVLGIPMLQIIFVRAVISAVLSLVDIRRAGVHPLGHKRGLLFARGFFGFAALTGVFYALIHLSMAQATLLQYLHPVFTALLAFLFLAERPTAATLSCIVLSLMGLACIVSPYAVAADAQSLPVWPLLAERQVQETPRSGRLSDRAMMRKPESPEYGR